VSRDSRIWRVAQDDVSAFRQGREKVANCGSCCLVGGRRRRFAASKARTNPLDLTGTAPLRDFIELRARSERQSIDRSEVDAV
jgi:hypothetical protein